MPYGRLLGLLIFLAACRTPSDGPSGDDTAGDPDAATEPGRPPSADLLSAVDAAGPDAAAACAAPRSAGWAGTVRWDSQDGAGIRSADVSWTYDRSDGCIDFYVASGTVRNEGVGDCATTLTPAEVPLVAGDAGMVVWRDTDPPTYLMGVTKRWSAFTTCARPASLHIHVEMGELRGIIDGATFGGGVDASDGRHDWRFVRTGTTVTPPVGCVEPPSDSIQGVHRVRRSYANVTATVAWIRTATDGCVDRFEPTGTSTINGIGHTDCQGYDFAPGSHPVSAADGVLTIDRSTDPPTFRSRGLTRWPGTTTCSHPDVSSETHEGMIGGSWGTFDGPLTGTRTVGFLAIEEPPFDAYGWELTR